MNELGSWTVEIWIPTVGKGGQPEGDELRACYGLTSPHWVSSSVQDETVVEREGNASSRVVISACRANQRVSDRSEKAYRPYLLTAKMYLVFGNVWSPQLWVNNVDMGSDGRDRHQYHEPQLGCVGAHYP